MSDTKLPVAMAVAMLGRTTQSDAHHGPSTYDFDQTLTLQGVLTAVEWFNPHIYLKLETEAEDGDRVEWLIASASSSGQAVRLQDGTVIEFLAQPSDPATEAEFKRRLSEQLELQQ